MPRLSPRTIQLLLLALITMAHVATRLESLRQYPLGKRLFFPESFRYSLAVMAGLGLNPVPFSGDPTSIPLQDFLAVQSEGISAQEFEAWKQSRLSAETVHDSPLTYEDQHLTWPLYTTRVLDLLVAAAIWSVMGIQWNYLFIFYLVLSATGPACLWLMTRALTGNGWTGLVAAVLYVSNPLEMVFVSFSPRDISPLWFAIPAWTSLACLIGQTKSWTGHLGACLLTGFLAGLGLGWRHDALVTVVAITLLAGPLVLASGGSWARAATAPIFCYLGTRPVVLAIFLACPAPPQQSGVGFHMAYYAEETRCSLFHLENSSGISRDDLQVMQRVAQVRADSGLPPIPFDPSHCHELYGPDHARITQSLLLDSLRTNAYAWLTHVPEFAWRALAATRLVDLPIGGHIRLQPLRDEPIGGIGRHLLAPLSWVATAVPTLFIAGIVLVAGLGLAPGPRERLLAAGLSLFSMAYIGILFLILPEFKHTGLLVVPMASLGAAGLAQIVKLLSAEGRATVRAGIPHRWARITGGITLTLLLIWLGLLPVAWYTSKSARAATVATVNALATQANWQVNEGDPLTQELRRNNDELNHAEVWLVEVQTAESGVRLACRQAHHDRPEPLVQYYNSPSTLFQTWHRVPKGNPCIFALSLTAHGAFGDKRPDMIRLDMLGNGRIVRMARIAAPEGGLPWLRTVVAQGDSSIGNPALRTFSRSGHTLHGLDTRYPVMGLRPAHIEKLDDPALKPAEDDLTAAYDPLLRLPPKEKRAP